MGKHKGYERNELIRAAKFEFWGKGFANTSIQNIEKATGVNKSGIYSEFESKDHLFSACLKNYSEESGVFQTLNRAPLGWQNIRKLLLLMGENGDTKGCFIVNSMAEFRSLPQNAKEIISEHTVRLESEVIRNLKADNTSLSQARDLVPLILTFGNGLAIKTNTGDTKNLSRQIDRFLDFCKNSRLN